MIERDVARLHAWIADHAPLVTPERSETEHIDRLFGTPAGSDLVGLGLEAYEQAIPILGAQTKTIMAALVIPLTDVEVLVPAAPISDDVLREVSNEPPSFALIHRQALEIIQRVEEYRAPANVPRLGPPADSYCFYRAFRDEDAMRRGWEFGRCLAIYHTGPRHLPD